MDRKKMSAILRHIASNALPNNLSSNTVEALLNAADIVENDYRPIYVIMMMEKSGEDPVISKSGKNLGWPDLGCTAEMGFYHEMADAIEAMHENACDIRECCYDYGFVLKQTPGLYSNVGKDDRIYFKWDDNKQGFYETEEPKRLGILAL